MDRSAEPTRLPGRHQILPLSQVEELALLARERGHGLERVLLDEGVFSRPQLPEQAPILERLESARNELVVADVVMREHFGVTEYFKLADRVGSHDRD